MSGGLFAYAKSRAAYDIHTLGPPICTPMVAPSQSQCGADVAVLSRYKMISGAIAAPTYNFPGSIIFPSTQLIDLGSKI